MEDQTVQLHQMLSKAPVVVFEWSPNACPEVGFVSDNVRHFLGYDPEAFLSGRLRFSRMIFENDRNDFFVELESLNGRCRQVEHKLLRIVNEQGTAHWVRIISTPVTHSEGDGSPRYWAFVVDGSRERALDQARCESEERFRQMFDTNLAVKLLIDPEDGRIVEANQAAVEFYGYSAEDLASMTISQINMLSSGEVSLEMQRAKNEERLFFNFRHRLASGEIRDVEVYSCPVRSDEGIVLYSIVVDVTDRSLAMRSLEESHRKLGDVLSELQVAQEKMVQRERLAAVGQLTAGIAHDFNNIMTGIACTAEMMQLTGDLTLTQQNDVAQIQSSGERATKLIRQLLDFSRQSSPDLQTVDVVSAISHVVDFLRRMVPENICIEFQTPLAEAFVKAAPTAVQQVVTNLVLNARDAIDGEGKISIGITRANVQQTEACRICDSPFSGEWIRLDVRDNGCGIAVNDLPKIFEPFYTNKVASLGSGLGLSQIAGIIEQHDGHIAVESVAGIGTTISCFIRPCSSPQEIAAPDDGEEIILGNQELILLVEDDPMVRQTCQSMIEFLNYRVLSAENGKAALNAYRMNRESIAVVISDTVMPDMGGVELRQALKQLEPNIKFLLMSGYPLGEQDTADLKEFGWLDKPIRVSTLSVAIRRAIGC